MDRSTKIVIELLAKGAMTQQEIATTFDVTPSAISQIADKYSDEIDKLAADSKITAIGTDAKLSKLENTLLGKLEERIPHETDLRVLAGIYKIVNGAVRRGQGERPAGEGQPVVSLQLSQHFIQNNVNYIKDSYGQVVQVGDTQLTTANASNVRAMLNQSDTETTIDDGEELANEMFGPATNR